MTIIAKLLDEPRVRFNGGFWDGVADIDNGRKVRDVSDHFDKFYALGYSRGISYRQMGFDGHSSDEAFEATVEWAHESCPRLAAELIQVSADTLATMGERA